MPGKILFTTAGPNIRRNAATVKSAIPGLNAWDVFAGGTGAAEGKYAYAFNAPDGRRYSVSPYTTRSGRHAGYILTVTPGQRGLHAWITPNGEENSTGVGASYRSPQAAVGVARKHYAGTNIRPNGAASDFAYANGAEAFRSKRYGYSLDEAAANWLAETGPMDRAERAAWESAFNRGWKEAAAKKAPAKKRTNASGATTISYNAEYDEYVVKKGRSTYHTDDYIDAVGTAKVMAAGGPVTDKTPKGRKAAKRTNGAKSVADPVAAHELELYIENEPALVAASNSLGKLIMRNLARMILRGTYDSTKAWKAWVPLADEGAKRYTREFGDRFGTGFNKATREMVANSLAEAFESDVRLGAIDPEALVGVASNPRKRRTR